MPCHYMLLVGLVLNFFVAISSTPTEPHSSSQVIVNGGFENGIEPWDPVGPIEPRIVSTSPHSGTNCVLVEGRTDSWNGILQDITDKLTEGVSYSISAWMNLRNSPTSSDTFTITMVKTDDTGIDYNTIYSGSAVESSWTKGFGTYTLEVTGVLTELLLFVDGPSSGVDFYLDDVNVSTLSTPSPVVPTPSITPSPTYQGLTFSPTSTFEGPFISASKSSENVVIPDPPLPIFNIPRLECPHLADGLISWNDPDIWGGQVPTSGDVTVPPNLKVLVQTSIANELGIVTVPPTSELIFGEDVSGITMDVAGFEVKGSLRAGSETCRLNTPIKITLHGDRPPDITTTAVAPSYKGISVTGVIDLHGKRYYRTWTRLAKTVRNGDNVLLLQHSVNWEAGQEIVLVTTAMKDSREWHQNEVLIISSVITTGLPPEVGAAVYLTSDVQYTHLANSGYQAEVGLLTRMITIEGASDDSEPTDPDPGTCSGSVWNYGDSSHPCPDKELTGYGGHIIVHSGGIGFVEGVELYRMGQTNVLGRYPIHFHVLGTNCEGCYFRDSSIHRSYYRCISVHATNNLIVSENVGYDVTGYCYYLEDGVEEYNTISFNLAALIHFIGTEALNGEGQETPLAYQSPDLTLPADVTASGFYITNMHNNVTGNAASGGWAGFAFPVLHSPIGQSKNVNMRPSSRVALNIDGNTVHSSAWWWEHAGGFYIGGALYFNTDGESLVYSAGRDQDHERSPCRVDPCSEGYCDGFCLGDDRVWNRITNSKVSLVAGVGMNSWSGRAEVIGYEVHDVGLSLESLESGFWIDDMLAECRSGEDLAMPIERADYIQGHGFFWYDTGQEHIISNAVFRNCGYRSDLYNQYDTSPTRGCGDSIKNGCDDGSTVFGFLTHSDIFTPEVMQGTRNISFENCGRRFRLFNNGGDDAPSTVSGRGQNWLDVDGTVSGFGEPTLIGSGLSDVGLWWKVEPEVVYDPQGPLEFIKKNNGKNRGLGHITLKWDESLHNTYFETYEAVGHVRHYGPMFDSNSDPIGGLRVTANPDIVGPVGGFGWLLKLDGGAPHSLHINFIEVSPETPLILGIAYPPSTSFTITAHAAFYCSENEWYKCQEVFQPVNSVEEVRNSIGNTYHFDNNTGLLTIRIIMAPQTFTGDPNWRLWNFDMPGAWDIGQALERFERSGVFLPKYWYEPYLEILADCDRSGAYCSETPPAVDPEVCYPGYEQVAYDKCCKVGSPTECEYA